MILGDSGLLVRGDSGNRRFLLQGHDKGGNRLEITDIDASGQEFESIIKGALGSKRPVTVDIFDSLYYREADLSWAYTYNFSMLALGFIDGNRAVVLILMIIICTHVLEIAYHLQQTCLWHMMASTISKMST